MSENIRPFLFVSAVPPPPRRAAHRPEVQSLDGGLCPEPSRPGCAVRARTPGVSAASAGPALPGVKTRIVNILFLVVSGSLSIFAYSFCRTEQQKRTWKWYR